MSSSDVIGSASYLQHATRLLNIVRATGEPIEGNILTQHLSLEAHGDQVKPHNLAEAARKSAHIFEIGFNSGFSSLLFLVANPSASVTALDLGEHAYVRGCFEYLQSTFGAHRIELFVGDSAALMLHNEDVRVRASHSDLFHIDGGHQLQCTTMDLKNCFECARDGAIVIADDTQQGPVNAAWRAFVAVGCVQEANTPEDASALGLGQCRFDFGWLRHGLGCFRKPAGNAFQQIYDRNAWPGALTETKSGGGSSLRASETAAAALRGWIAKYGGVAAPISARTADAVDVLDVGSGEMNWQKCLLQIEGVRYLGVDIVPSVVAHNRLLRCGSAHAVTVRYECADAAKAALPRCSISVAREVLFHLPLADAELVYAKLWCGARYLAATTHPLSRSNVDLPQRGSFYEVNMQRAPFLLGAPLERVAEATAVGREFALWDLSAQPEPALHAMVTALIVFQHGEIAAKAEMLVRSLRHFHPNLAIVAGVNSDTEHYGRLEPSTEEFLRESRVRVLLLSHPFPQYKIANKVYLLREALARGIVETPLALLLDSDLVLMRPLELPREALRADVSAVLAHCASWNGDWEHVMQRCGAPAPSREPQAKWSTSESRQPQRAPYCNSGVVLVRAGSSLPQQWVDRLELLFDDERVSGRFPWLDQITLAACVHERERGNDFCALAWNFNRNSYVTGETVFFHYHHEVEVGEAALQDALRLPSGR
ncbi:Hypothetical protein UVM_LOCUS274 [uncultured virus]|nr:Hypothetical protein UVM_LOCUS274 [uncultured virus]